MNLLRPFLLMMGLCWTIAMAVMPAPAHAESKTRVKAAMVYNIMRFINFPDDPRNLRLCGILSEPSAADLRTLDGRMVGNARVDVILVSNASDIGTSCDVIYLGSVDKQDSQAGQNLIQDSFCGGYLGAVVDGGCRVGVF